MRSKYIFTILTVQKPYASVMLLECRLELLELSKTYSVPIFEDDCYADLLLKAERPPAIRSLDPTGRVIYCGFFSKSIATAFRAGYLVADWNVIAQILPLKRDVGTSAFEQMVLAEYAKNNFDQHVFNLQHVLHDKCQTMADV